ncbi:two-component system, OmpR family, sensor histidine kinase ChvG [Aliiroseovarius sediminilitoris]|uniref:histidine kinase n=1 Tax=Aliiroseovarius sediminilitoris TaxID=1173584 RepID=A0A1I0N3Q1_9RHOB|nr:sensor histidine kinase [Aliiroseovarius sediminilitoris]SEV95696.1 two-component system, OmpR family, sensor histidine kinase ChvG [Aliiroseovarius sediminilitoris]
MVTKVKDTKATTRSDLVLGEDWVSPSGEMDYELRNKRAQRGLISINRSPLARKIITFNLLGLVVLVAGVLYLNPFRDSLLIQRERGLVVEAELIADVFEAQLVQASENQAVTAPEQPNLPAPEGEVMAEVVVPAAPDFAETLSDLQLPVGLEVFVFDANEALLARSVGVPPAEPTPVDDLGREIGSTIITDLLNAVWEGVSGIVAKGDGQSLPLDTEVMARTLYPGAMNGATRVSNGVDENGGTVFSVATPILQNGVPAGVVAITSATGELDLLVRAEREQLLQMFVIAILVSIGLSLVLASTIANPLSDLAAAAELGRDKDSNSVRTGRVRIPDLTARPDEIGRLSGALRGMVAALYDRIDSNEQFAADVAHEIKNPLASLRSAIGTLRLAKKDEHRGKLLDVIDHDVRRLDRLVSDISNASRLDSELVKEEEEEFNLLKMLRNLTEYLGNEGSDKGVEFITDLPPDPIFIRGLEARLAQVFVNLITNALSFCDEGDAIRVWVRRRENRVLVVIEDTGPGIPEQALSKIFKRFYSERPESQFGNNSGLGLAISKQIVEAHGGVIWAENIRPTDADLTSDPLGARFVVGLPV